MPGKGRPFQKGVSGNPGGRPRQDPEVRALCEKFTPAAIATLAEIMGNKKAQPWARVAAAMAILKKTLPDLASVEHTLQPSSRACVTIACRCFYPHQHCCQW